MNLDMDTILLRITGFITELADLQVGLFLLAIRFICRIFIQHLRLLVAVQAMGQAQQ